MIDRRRILEQYKAALYRLKGQMDILFPMIKPNPGIVDTDDLGQLYDFVCTSLELLEEQDYRELGQYIDLDMLYREWETHSEAIISGPSNMDVSNFKNSIFDMLTRMSEDDRDE